MTLSVIIAMLRGPSPKEAPMKTSDYAIVGLLALLAVSLTTSEPIAAAPKPVPKGIDVQTHRQG